MSRSILLISYFFPPFPDIGGRRWAKFSKYLSRNGVHVHVVCAKNPFKNESLWNADVVRDPNIKIYPVKGTYPVILEKVPKTIFEKIKYRASLALVSVLSKGSPYDRSLFWNRHMRKKAGVLIREKSIRTVIVSSAPFHTAYEATLLKRHHRAKVVCDLRDPWTWGTGWGFNQLSSKRSDYELKLQDHTVLNADLVLSPVEVMSEHLRNRYPEAVKRIKTLPHGYDPDEIVEKSVYREKSFRLVLYGTLYKGIEAYIANLATVVRDLGGRMTIDIFTDSNKYSGMWSENGCEQWVNYYRPLSGKALFQKLTVYDYVLMIHPLFGVNNLSTKFYEVVACRIPIIYIGEEGSTAAFIVDNQLGTHLDLAGLETRLPQIVDGTEKLVYNAKFDVSGFSYPQITLQLIRILEELENGN
jgi:hypothetical protein